MKEKLCSYYQRYKTFILYACYGIPPTIISFGGYFLLIELICFPAYLASAISWSIALMISFILYRKFVFHSVATTIKEICYEFVRFTSIRITSGLMETGLVWLFIDVMHLHRGIFKVLASFLSALFNYIISKWFVFKRNANRSQWLFLWWSSQLGWRFAQSQKIYLKKYKSYTFYLGSQTDFPFYFWVVFCTISRQLYHPKKVYLEKATNLHL